MWSVGSKMDDGPFISLYYFGVGEESLSEVRRHSCRTPRHSLQNPSRSRSPLSETPRKPSQTVLRLSHSQPPLRRSQSPTLSSDIPSKSSPPGRKLSRSIDHPPPRGYHRKGEWDMYIATTRGTEKVRSGGRSATETARCPVRMAD